MSEGSGSERLERDAAFLRLLTTFIEMLEEHLGTDRAGETKVSEQTAAELDQLGRRLLQLKKLADSQNGITTATNRFH